MASMRETDSLGEMARIAGFLPLLEQQISKMDRTLETKVFALMNKGTLTPDMALYFWQEKLALRRLLSHFNQSARIGQAIGENIKDEVEWR